MDRSIRYGDNWFNCGMGDREVEVREGFPEWSRNEPQSYIRTKWGRLYFDSIEHRPELAKLARRMFPKIGAASWDRGSWGFACDSFSSGTLVWISNDGDRARYGYAWVTSLSPAFKEV